MSKITNQNLNSTTSQKKKKNNEKKIQKKRNEVYGSVILLPLIEKIEERNDWSHLNGLYSPHLLLVSDYKNGKFKIPGGKVEENETNLEGINRLFYHGTGFSTIDTITIPSSNTRWTFTEEDLRFRYVSDTRNCDFFLKIILLSKADFHNSELWRPMSRPINLGENAGLSWMVITNKSDEFPRNMMDCNIFVQEKRPGSEKYMNHHVIWNFCLELVKIHGKGQCSDLFQLPENNPLTNLPGLQFSQVHFTGLNEQDITLSIDQLKLEENQEENSNQNQAESVETTLVTPPVLPQPSITSTIESDFDIEIPNLNPTVEENENEWQ